MRCFKACELLHVPHVPRAAGWCCARLHVQEAQVTSMAHCPGADVRRFPKCLLTSSAAVGSTLGLVCLVRGERGEMPCRHILLQGRKLFCS